MKYDEPKIMDAGEPVSVAISEIIRGQPCVVVTKNNEYYGIFGELDVRNVNDTSKENVGTSCRRAPILNEGADTREAVREFMNGRFKALPVRTKEGIKLLSRTELLSHIASEKLIPNAMLGEVMSFPAYALEDGETVGKARDVMRKNNVRRVVITNNGRIAGILAMHDLLTMFKSPKGRLPFLKDRHGIGDQPVKDYMKRDVNVLPPDAMVSDAIELFRRTNIASVVISEGDRPLGLLSMSDLFEMAIAHKEPEPIHFSGLDKGDEGHITELRTIADRAFEKAKNMARIEYLALHYKKQRYKGLRSRYEVRVRAKGDGITTVSSADWDIRTATQGAMKELLTVIKRQVGRERDTSAGKARDRRRV